MTGTQVEHEVTLWMVNDAPTRMFYVGKRWRVTDTPTRLRESVWSVPGAPNESSLHGWRFQATSTEGDSYVFDLFRSEEDWHVHHMYAQSRWDVRKSRELLLESCRSLRRC